MAGGPMAGERGDGLRSRPHLIFATGPYVAAQTYHTSEPRYLLDEHTGKVYRSKQLREGTRRTGFVQIQDIFVVHHLPDINAANHH